MPETATKTAPTPTPSGITVDWDKHLADQQRRAEEREAKRPQLIECLDPEAAAEHEARKKQFTFKVSCTILKRNQRGRLRPEDFSGTVRAHDEGDAWAKFCDEIGEHPSPRSCQRKIEKVAGGADRRSKDTA